MDNQPETGVNKQFAQAEATKDSDKKKEVIPVKVEKVKPTGWQMDIGTGVYLRKKGHLSITLAGTEVGEIWVEDTVMRFKGNVDDSAAILLIALKKSVDNWLQLKEK